ncbi:hypothetical protein ACLOJK_022404 [Asimina triloba]
MARNGVGFWCYQLFKGGREMVDGFPPRFAGADGDGDEKATQREDGIRIQISPAFPPSDDLASGAFSSSFDLPLSRTPLPDSDLSPSHPPDNNPVLKISDTPSAAESSLHRLRRRRPSLPSP